MAERWSAGKIALALAKTTEQGLARNRTALTAVALDIERRAKVHVAEGGAHRAWEKSPASAGHGPAVISGQLRRSITHSQVVTPDEIVYRIGPASTPRVAEAIKTVHRKAVRKPPPSNGRVGRILEVQGVRNGSKFPFLMPAFVEGISLGPAIYVMEFNRSLKV